MTLAPMPRLMLRVATQIKNNPVSESIANITKFNIEDERKMSVQEKE